MVNEPHLTENELAQLVDGAIAGEARLRALAHLDRCEACRREVLTVGRVVSAGPEASAVRFSRAKRALVLVSSLAAAIAGLWLFPRLTRPGPEANFRNAAPTENLALIGVVSPSAGEAAARLTWRATRADSYRLIVLSEDGEPLWTVETSDTSIALPPETPLRAGGTYFWRVDAITEGVTASTGPRRFRVAPR